MKLRLLVVLAVMALIAMAAVVLAAATVRFERSLR